MSGGWGLFSCRLHEQHLHACSAPIADSPQPQPPQHAQHEERVASILRIAPPEMVGGALDRTLVCFVLVDRDGGHAFCSR